MISMQVSVTVLYYYTNIVLDYGSFVISWYVVKIVLFRFIISAIFISFYFYSFIYLSIQPDAHRLIYNAVNCIKTQTPRVRLILPPEETKKPNREFILPYTSS